MLDLQAYRHTQAHTQLIIDTHKAENFWRDKILEILYTYYSLLRAYKWLHSHVVSCTNICIEQSKI